jgi:hypothetical protein
MLNFPALIFVIDKAFRKAAQFRQRLTLKIMQSTGLFPFHTTSLHPASKLAPVNGSSGKCSFVYKLYLIPTEPASGNMCFVGKQAGSEGQICSQVSPQ